MSARHWCAAGLLVLAAQAGAAERACLDCHADQGLRRQSGASAFVEAAVLAASAHAGLQCADCHAGVGAEHPPELPAVDCGSCHREVEAEYAQSVHGTARAAGNPDVPTCASCHGGHAVAPPGDPASRVAPRNIPQTCASCHEEERLASRYGMPIHRYATYLDSYHGVVNRYGEAAVANCASCHGVHEIRPSSDPASSIHPANLGRTCGHCHPGAEGGLAGVKIHVEATPESSRGMYYVRTFYLYFTGLLVLCFVSYIAVEVYGSLRRRKRG
jgi:nitrate/TMAO reductase-like tetraheme cytochrome c subunit